MGEGELILSALEVVPPAAEVVVDPKHAGVAKLEDVVAEKEVGRGVLIVEGEGGGGLDHAHGEVVVALKIDDGGLGGDEGVGKEETLVTGKEFGGKMCAG